MLRDLGLQGGERLGVGGAFNGFDGDVLHLTIGLSELGGQPGDAVGLLLDRLLK